MWTQRQYALLSWGPRLEDATYIIIHIHKVYIHCGPLWSPESRKNHHNNHYSIVATYIIIHCCITLLAMHDGLMGHEGLVETGLAPTTIEYLNEEQLRELLFNRWKRGIVKCCSSVFGGKIAHSDVEPAEADEQRRRLVAEISRASRCTYLGEHSLIGGLITTFSMQTCNTGWKFDEQNVNLVV